MKINNQRNVSEKYAYYEVKIFKRMKKKRREAK